MWQINRSTDPLFQEDTLVFDGKPVGFLLSDGRIDLLPIKEGVVWHLLKHATERYAAEGGPLK